MHVIELFTILSANRCEWNSVEQTCVDRKVQYPDKSCVC